MRRYCQHIHKATLMHVPETIAGRKSLSGVDSKIQPIEIKAKTCF